VTRERIAAGPASIWRYADLLPVAAPAEPRLAPGFTPLVPAPRLAEELGVRELWLKLDTANPTRIRGEKFFLPKPDYGMTLNITLVCLPSNVGAAIYANALQTRYELKSAAASTGVSVAGVGSISLPWASDKEALIKVGEETIADPDFYRRLFGLIDSLQGS